MKVKYELISIYRAERYSPNSVERDKAIMDAVCEKLSTRYNIYKTREEDIETEGMPPMRCLLRPMRTDDFTCLLSFLLL